MSDLKVYDPRQLSTIIESLAHEAINKKSESAKKNLKDIFNSLNYENNPLNRSNFLKVFAVLSFLECNFAKAQEIIQSGQFDEFHHEFLRDIYKKCEMSRLYGQASSPLNRPKSLILYPESIETKDKDGIPITISAFLKAYYIKRKISKKAMNVSELAEKTNLSVEAVTRRLHYHREKMAPARAVSEPKKAKEVASLQLDINPETLYNPIRQDMFPFLPSPPMEAHDFFPTHRIPLDQPLTIIIPI